VIVSFVSRLIPTPSAVSRGVISSCAAVLTGDIAKADRVSAGDKIDARFPAPPGWACSTGRTDRSEHQAFAGSGLTRSQQGKLDKLSELECHYNSNAARWLFY
jgi:hypothetical protein